MFERKVFTKLPRVFRTEPNRKFLDATAEQLWSNKKSETFDAFVGRKAGGSYNVLKDGYLEEQTKNRKNYQLEPVALGKNTETLEKQNVEFYDTFIQRLDILGANTENHNRLFENEYYSFAPPIDIDKFVNYFNYRWVKERLPVLRIINIDDNEIEQNIIGAKNYSISLDDIENAVLDGNNNGLGTEIDLTSGLRVRFVDSNNYNVELTVEGVGAEIRLVPDKRTIIASAIEEFILYDSLSWDTFPWDYRLVGITDVDYITIERGSRDNNAWSRTNRWYHREVVELTARLLDTSITNINARRPIIEFIKDIEIYKGGRNFLQEVDFANTKSQEEIINSVYPSVDGRRLQNDDTLIFLPESQEPGTDLIYSVSFDDTTTATSQQNPSLTINDEIKINDVVITINTTDINDFVSDINSIFDNLSATVQNNSVVLTQEEGYNIKLENVVGDPIGDFAFSGTDLEINEADLQVFTTLVFIQEAQASEDDVILIINGTSLRGNSIVLLDSEWNIVPNQKTKTNQPPLFQLYDYNGIKLDNDTYYPSSTFEGSPIFNYKEDPATTIVDPVLELPVVTETTSVGSDFVMQNSLEAQREFYEHGSAFVEIAGYYFYNITSEDEEHDEFRTSWHKASGLSRQRIIDNYDVLKQSQDRFAISVPTWTDIEVFVNGAETANYTIDNQDIVFSNPKTKGDFVEIFTTSDYPLPKDTNGYYEIPQNLELNPNNEEVIEYTVTNFSQHFSSIITNQDGFTGQGIGSTNNYRDTEKDLSLGTRIVQNKNPMLKSMLFVSDNDINIIDAIRFSKREYSRFKNQLSKKISRIISERIQIGDVAEQKDNAAKWLDIAVRELDRTANFTNAYEHGHMFPWSDDFHNEEITLAYVNDDPNQGKVTEYETTVNTLSGDITIDLAKADDFLSVYHNNRLLIVDKDYEIVDDSPITIKFNIDLDIDNDNVVVRAYKNNTSPPVPSTPSKLGIYHVYQPRIEIDDTFVQPQEVIVGHDGSRTIAYGDLRDYVLLELERRIYNGIKKKYRTQYLPDLSIFDVKEGFYRDTAYSFNEFVEIQSKDFYRWTAVNGVDFRTNSLFDDSEELTWNYRNLGQVESLPAHWKGIFSYYYDTYRPHVAPWEMLGFSEEPSWWENEYGTYPWADTNLMWSDIENGIIKNGPREGTDERFIRNGLSQVLPVDSNGDLRTPINIGLVQQPSQLERKRDWVFGDGAPVEDVWFRSSEYAFAVAEFLFLTRPAKFGERFWDPTRNTIAPVNEEQDIDSEFLKRIGNSRLTVTGETDDDSNTIINSGYQQWLVDRLLFNEMSITQKISFVLRGLTTNLGYRVGGFTKRENLRAFAESLSLVSMDDSLLIPDENIDVKLHETPTNNVYHYGGVLIRLLEQGKFQVFGYDLLDPTFKIIPRKPGSRVKNVSVGGDPEPARIFKLGGNYSKGDLVRRNDQYYRALVDHQANTFDANNWARLNNRPSKNAIEVVKKIDGAENRIEEFEYGTVFNDVQEVYDFLIGYGDYLESNGWVFDGFDNETSDLKNWDKVGKDFLFWLTLNWNEGATISLSPASDNVKLEIDFGYPEEIGNLFNDVYSILNAQGTPIDINDVVVGRDNQLFEIEPLDTQNEGIYGLYVSTKVTEHIILFDNFSVFNDTIYDPLLGSRQQRINVRGIRTTDWFGKKQASGYLVRDNTIVPNYENLVDSIRDYYDIENNVENPELDDLFKNSVGFQTKEYLTNLGLSKDTQFDFYRGFIKEKGTKSSIDRLERSRISDSEKQADTLEEWAFLNSDFGASCQNLSFDLSLDPVEASGDPQLIDIDFSGDGTVTDIDVVSSEIQYTQTPDVIIASRTNDNGSGARAKVTIDGDGFVTEIEVTDEGSGYGVAPLVYIGENGNYDDAQQAEAVIEKAINTGTVGDGVQTIDIDDTDRFLTRPRGCGKTNLGFPVTEQTEFTIPNAGYVHYNDVKNKAFETDDVFGVYERFESAVIETITNLNGVVISAQIVNPGYGYKENFTITAPGSNGDTELKVIVTNRRVKNVKVIHADNNSKENGLTEQEVKLKSPVLNSFIWIAKSVNRSWNVYKAYESDIEILDVNSNIVTLSDDIPEESTGRDYLNGIIIISDVVYRYVKTDPETYELFTEDNEAAGTENIEIGDNIVVFRSMRFDDTSSITPSEEVYLDDDDLVWIDEGSSGGWKVKIVDKAKSPENYENHREQEDLIATKLFDNGILYQRDTGETIALLPVYDPYKGLIPGMADENVSWKTHADPARYTNSDNEKLIDENTAFGEKQVGKTWWDLDSVRYVYYEQGTSKDRRDNWGKKFPGSEIEVYEWVRSNNPPASYTGEGIPKNTTDYTVRRIFNERLNEYRNYYYFWVQNKTTRPQEGRRTLSVAEVASLISNPTGFAFRWIAPVSKDSLVLRNTSNLVADSDSVLQLNYSTSEKHRKTHHQWKLTRESDSRSSIPDHIVNKMIDSVIGEDAQGNVVPQNGLSEEDTYGISIRPRQTLIKNTKKARKVLVDKLNELLKDIPLLDDDPFWVDETDADNITEFGAWFSEFADDESTKATFRVGSTPELNTSDLPEIEDGDTVRVTGDRDSIYIYDEDNNLFNLKAREETRLIVKDNVYKEDTQTIRNEIRELINKLFERTFTNGLLVKKNQLLFALLHYILSENENPDWVFKTTYLYLKQFGNVLTQDAIFRPDPFNSLLDYVNETKPYSSKIRDYLVTKTTDPELVSFDADLQIANSMNINQDRFVNQFTTVELRILKDQIEDDGDATLYDSKNKWDTFLWGDETWDELIEIKVKFGNIGRYVDTVLRKQGLLNDIKDPEQDPNSTDFKIKDNYSLNTVPTDQDEQDAVDNINSIIQDVFGTVFREKVFDADDFNQDGDLVVETDSGFEEVEVADIFTGDGVKRRYSVSFVPEEHKIAVFIDDIQELNFKITDDDRIFFFVAPENGSEIKIYDLAPIDSGDFLDPYADGDPPELARYSPVENMVLDVEVNTTSVSQDPFITEEFEGRNTGAWDNFLWDTINWGQEVEGRYDVLPFDAFENVIVYFNGTEQQEGIDYEYQQGGTANRELLIFNYPHTENDIIVVEYYDPLPVAYKFHYGPVGNDTPYRKCDSQTTTLTVGLQYDDTEIQVSDASVVDPGTLDGRIWIGSELIEFDSIDGNTLKGIKRGVQGTHIPLTHTSGKDVINANDNQIVPDSDDFWISNIGGLTASTFTPGVFLRNCPWRRA